VENINIKLFVLSCEYIIEPRSPRVASNAKALHEGKEEGKHVATRGLERWERALSMRDDEDGQWFLREDGNGSNNSDNVSNISKPVTPETPQGVCVRERERERD